MSLTQLRGPVTCVSKARLQSPAAGYRDDCVPPRCARASARTRSGGNCWVISSVLNLPDFQNLMCACVKVHAEKPVSGELRFALKICVWGLGDNSVGLLVKFGQLESDWPVGKAIGCFLFSS